MNELTARRALALAAAFVAASVSFAEAAWSQSIEVAMSEQAAADRAAAAAQERINTVNDETQGMVVKYRQALTDAESFKQYNDQLAVQLASQADEIAAIKRQLNDIDVTARDVLPLMQKMADTLEKFIALDVPFLQEERSKRAATLKSILPRADVTISEKYRRILEAYQIEMEYGRTLDAYDGKLEDGKESKTVEFVRLGRVALLYRTLDGKEIGYWDAGKKGWAQDDSLGHLVRAALRVAKKQGAPDLLLIPVPAPKKVSP